MIEHHEPVFKGIWIPAEVWEGPLTLLQKLLWATISSLGKKSRPCTASNAWLAMRMNVSEGTVANQLSTMRKGGWIIQVAFDGRRREMLAVVPESDEGRVHEIVKSGSLNNEPSVHESVNPEPPSIVQENKVENKGKGTAAPNGADKSEKRRLTDLWCSEYPVFHSGACYVFEGAKDGRAADRLLAAGFTPESALSLAREAWKRQSEFWCSKAASLAGFVSSINQIRQEIKNGHNKTNSTGCFLGPNRGKGTANEGRGNDYRHEVVLAINAKRDAERAARGETTPGSLAELERQLAAERAAKGH